MLSEREITNRIIRKLKKKDLWFYKVCDRFTAGIPDIIICENGKFRAIEVKTKNGRLRPLQRHVIEKIRAAGGEAIVMRGDDVDDA